MSNDTPNFAASLNLTRPGRLFRSTPMYRIRRNGQEPITDVDQVEAIEPAIRSSEPSRYHVGEIIADPLPSGDTSRRCGSGSNGRMDRLPLSQIHGLNG
jgi:hypothetical protein